jgi:TolA-binding protein
MLCVAIYFLHSMLFFKLRTTISVDFFCSVKKLSMRCLFILPFLFFSFFHLSAQDLLSQQIQERLYRTAIDQMDKSHFGAARESFSQFLSMAAPGDMRSIEAEYYLSFCALNLHHADAEKRFADFIADYPLHPKSISANYDLANFFYVEKNYKKAASYFSKVDFSGLPIEQQNSGRFQYGYSQFSQKSLKESLDQFNFIKAQGGKYGPAASYYAGFVEYSQGDFDNAIIDLKRAEQNEAYSKIVPYVMASVYYKQKKYDELLKYTSQLTNKQGITNIEEISLLSAEAYYKKGDNKNALAAYSTYLEGKEEKADKAVLFRAGHSAFLISEDEAALKYLKLSFSDTDSIGFYSAYYLGSLYLKKQQKPMALTSFDIARKFRPDQKLVEEATFQFAKIAYELGRSDQAISEFEKLLKSFPASVHTVEIKELLSQAYVNANNYNKAIEYIESMPNRSTAINRAYQKATLLKGLDFFNKEQYSQASEYFEKSQQYPIDEEYLAEACFWNGESYSIQKKYELASKQYLKVIGLEGYSNAVLLSKVRYGLGYSYFNLQQYDRSLFNFKEFVTKAAKDQPNLADGIVRLADCYYVSKEYNEAIVNYRRAISLNSADVDYAHLQLGVVLGILRKYKEASAELELVIKNYPHSRFLDEALFQRAQMDFEQGIYASAVVGYSKVITSFPTSRFAPYAFTRRAASYYNLKDFNKTSDDYITVLTNYPNHPASKDVLLPLQESLNLAGRSSEFDKYLSDFKLSNPDSKGIEAVEYEAAKNFYFNQEYAKAIQRLIAYTTQYPDSPRLTEANYYLAEANYRTKDFVKALSIYYTINEDKTFTFANKVIGRIAELEFRQGKYASAIPSYHQLVRVAANKKEQYTAWNGLMESYYFLAQYDSAKFYAETILEKGSVNAGAANKASLYLGKIAKDRGDFETAKDEFLTTINSAQDEYGAEAKYLLGELFYLRKDHKQCYETLVSMNTDFAGYTEWVGKSYLLLSENFLAVGDEFNAKAVLKSLIDNFPIESVKRTASDRLQKLDMAEKSKSEKIKADTLDNEK